MNDAMIYKLFSLPFALAGMDPMNYYLFDNEKLMGLSISLLIEIDELFDMGYSMEKIEEIIKKCDFVSKNPELTKEDAEWLRNYSLNILPIRYRLYNEEKEGKGLKKRLTD